MPGFPWQGSTRTYTARRRDHLPLSQHPDHRLLLEMCGGYRHWNPHDFALEWPV